MRRPSNLELLLVAVVASIVQVLLGTFVAFGVGVILILIMVKGFPKIPKKIIFLDNVRNHLSSHNIE
jgi:hypothetical protein